MPEALLFIPYYKYGYLQQGTPVFSAFMEGKEGRLLR